MERPTVAVLGAPRTGKTSLIYALGRGLGGDVTCVSSPTSSLFALGKGVTALERCLDDVESALLDTRLVFLVFDVTAPETFAAVVAKGAALQSLDRTIALVGTNADLMPTDHDAVLVASEARIFASSEFALYAEVHATPPAGLDALLSLLHAAIPVKKPQVRKDIWLYDPYDDNAPPRSPTRAMNEIYLCGRAKALATERAISAKYEHKRYGSPKATRSVAPQPAPVPRQAQRRQSTGRHSTLMSGTQASVARVKAIQAYKPQREAVDPKIRVQWHRPRSPVDEAPVPVRRVETRAAVQARVPTADATAIDTSCHVISASQQSEPMEVPGPCVVLDVPTLPSTTTDGGDVVSHMDHNVTRCGISSQPDAASPTLPEVNGNADKTFVVSSPGVDLPTDTAEPEPSNTQAVDPDATFFDFDDDDAAVTFDDDDILDALDSFQLSI
ncbi:hypothetical protein SDRG_06717 [Saprolegnia diclina VS20]|uniref:Uncharacterized protein n=1 Tax=Saprolegnia diclina (strain VS20) TaxID=1156394 RepID=T0QQ63_SAPDV|nr:hypothetical protein SDRG_06717 [Saprolegnia diclina VS20]EQC35975.1 hypothetical protein SDRG_06717 [Saprolegnia diclina VS20]|eukprot:XP_008610737.1 hypothetical protein SDRG_06717 [Saprolegnia diclina VS20]